MALFTNFCYHTMIKSTGSLVLLFLLLLSFNSGGHAKFANGLEGLQSWCVAKSSASDYELQNNIDYACNNLSDCTMIQPGGSCYEPNNLINHASVVMNQYYALEGRNTWNCYFSGSALIAVSDPSYGSCNFA